MTTRRLVGAGALYLCLLCAIWHAPGSASAATVRIQEVFYDEVGSDGPGVFTELLGAAGYDLSGWTLVGVNGAGGLDYGPIDLTGAVIPADGILVIAAATAAGPLLAVRDFVADVNWQNGPDAVQLRDGEDLVVDALQYGDAVPQNAGEGSPAPNVTAGVNLSRDLFGTDTNDNATDFALLAVPTPGIGPQPLQVPMPNAFWLGIARGFVCATFRALRRRPWATGIGG